ncbi:hypothetical protein JCM8202_006211 [Rhodotorula sphaerocarpa]
MRAVQTNHDNAVSSTVYGSRSAATGIPRFEMGEDELDPRLAQRFVQDELLMSGTPALNLASFTTFMEPEACELMAQTASMNFIDVEEYPAMAEIESRCINMIARLLNAPLDKPESEACGVSTVGSSEAIILATLAAKRRWKEKREAAGKSTDKPNIVMSAAVQVCWEKAARYLEVEEKYWYCSPGKYLADPEELVDLVDENTILVVGILGTTYTGGYEDVEKIHELLEKKNKELGLDVTIHVDAASGGFVAPFVNPSLVWDFRLPLVSSINVSGHKYGLTFAGVGWNFWRDRSYIPDHIVFTVNYLGSPQASLTLNFSKSGEQVVGQYYQLLRLGKAGYRAIMSNVTQTADHLAEAISQMGGGKLFRLISAGQGMSLPLVAFQIAEDKPYDEFAIATHLRQRGWIVPAYTMAPHTEKMKLLRVVVREDFSRSRCDTFIRDLSNAIDWLEAAPVAVQTHLSKSDEGDKSKSDNPKHPHDHTTIHHHEKHSLAGQHGKTHAVC